MAVGDPDRASREPAGLDNRGAQVCTRAPLLSVHDCEDSATMYTPTVCADTQAVNGRTS